MNPYVIQITVGFLATVVATAIGVFVGMIMYEKFKKG